MFGSKRATDSRVAVAMMICFLLNRLGGGDGVVGGMVCNDGDVLPEQQNRQHLVKGSYQLFIHSNLFRCLLMT